MERKDILDCIFDAIDAINESKEQEDRLKKTEQTILFGRDGKLDSLGLVNLIVSVEQAVSDETGLDITLADERAMSQESSPFKTVGTLCGYIVLLINEQS